MASTVRIGDDDKERLRRLQEAWQRTRGQRPTQQELLGKGLAYLERHRDAFLRESAWRPMTAEEVEGMKAAFQFRSGRTEPYEIDELVYGQDRDPAGEGQDRDPAGEDA